MKEPLGFADAYRLGKQAAAWGWSLEQVERQARRWSDTLRDEGYSEEEIEAEIRHILEGYRDWKHQQAGL